MLVQVLCNLFFQPHVLKLVHACGQCGKQRHSLTKSLFFPKILNITIISSTQRKSLSYSSRIDLALFCFSAVASIMATIWDDKFDAVANWNNPDCMTCSMRFVLAKNVKCNELRSSQRVLISADEFGTCCIQLLVLDTAETILVKGPGPVIDMYLSSALCLFGCSMQVETLDDKLIELTAEPMYKVGAEDGWEAEYGGRQVWDVHNERRYNLPTMDEIAAIVTGDGS